MEYIFEYFSKDERQLLIESNSHKYLIKEKNIREGNFLIFTDVKPIEIELEELRNKVATQDTVMEELMFTILPELTGGGI